MNAPQSGPTPDVVSLPCRLLILDDFFPNLLTGFRVAEFNGLFRAFPNARCSSIAGDYLRSYPGATAPHGTGGLAVNRMRRRSPSRFSRRFSPLEFGLEVPEAVTVAHAYPCHRVAADDDVCGHIAVYQSECPNRGAVSEVDTWQDHASGADDGMTTQKYRLGNTTHPYCKWIRSK